MTDQIITPTKTIIFDPRRHKPIKIQWNGLIGRLLIDGESWGAVEWSEKRKAFCIEDAEGRCLSHHSHVHGEDKDKAGAVALAEAMIRDGRMPTPEQAKAARAERLKRDRERRAKLPSEIKRRQKREEIDRLWRSQWDAEVKEREAEDDDPLFEVMIGALDLTNPDLWKSNSFARVRSRLIIHLQAVIADLEYAIAHGRSDDDDRRRLDRARQVLEVLITGHPVIPKEN